jgi:cyclohexanone monooxygenase
MPEDVELDVVVVGAGFAGLYMLHSLRGLGLSCRVIEAGSGVGGTWYWNRYPGARCDVPSLEYSFGFDDEIAREWTWSERYATQPEILRYLEFVADRLDLGRDIVFDTRVVSARFDEVRARWSVATDGGETIDCRHLIMATGCLSAANMPDIEGTDDFAGPTYHTGRWPRDGVEFGGRRVGVIGTGSSAVQCIPLIAEQAAEVLVFQRTPAYAVPAHNHRLDPAEVERIKAGYPEWREIARNTGTGLGGHLQPPDTGALEVDESERRRIYDERWAAGGLSFLASFNDLMFDPAANETAAAYVRERISEIVDDPAVAEQLSPDTVIGCKRMCVDTGYYETYNRPNVHLIDISETPIDRLTPDGIEVDGTLHECDAVVFATGFDAMTGAIDRIDIHGRDGQPLREKWSAGPLTYLGLQVSGFPNLFMITGPGSPSVLTNMVVAIEQHVEWIRDTIDHMQAEGVATIEPETDAETQWVAYVNAVAELTLFNGCSSWYLGTNVPGKPRVFMPLPGFLDYKQKCDEVAAAGYEGFVLSPACS